jgi:hypothetical protein
VVRAKPNQQLARGRRRKSQITHEVSAKPNQPAAT